MDVWASGHHDIAGGYNGQAEMISGGVDMDLFNMAITAEAS